MIERMAPHEKALLFIGFVAGVIFAGFLFLAVSAFAQEDPRLKGIADAKRAYLNDYQRAEDMRNALKRMDEAEKGYRELEKREQEIQAENKAKAEAKPEGK